MENNKKTVFCPENGEHPKIYLSLDEENPTVKCPYCQKEFSLDK